MKLANLIANLENPDTTIRRDIARVLGLVQETEALKAIGTRYNAEPDPDVKETLSWAGKRIFTAQKQGYNTRDTIFKHFKVDKEIENATNQAEEALMKQMQQTLEIEMIRRTQNAAQKKANMATAAGLAGSVLGGGMMGAGMAAGALSAGADAASSNMGSDRPAIGKTRIPATMPGTMPINRWVNILKTSDDASQRIRAAKELLHLNNPAALPHLAEAFITDASPPVKEEALKTGTQLYLSTVYWHMEQDGSLQRAIDKRIADIERPPAAPAPNDDLDSILRKAKQARINRYLKDQK